MSIYQCFGQICTGHAQKLLVSSFRNSDIAPERNTLPRETQDIMGIDTFKRKLKTFLFECMCSLHRDSFTVTGHFSVNHGQITLYCISLCSH